MKRVSKTRKIFWFTAAVVLMAGFAGAAIGASVEPDLVDPWTSGDAADECGQIACDAEFAYKIDNWDGPEDGFYPHAGNVITITNSDAKTFDWASNYPVCAVIVKASTRAYVYYYGGAYSDTALVAPLGKDISHATFCFSGPADEPCATISGIKFHDRNGDGLRAESGEELLSGWTIRLSKYDDVDGWVWISDDETDENGAYSFTVHEAGAYKIEELSKDGWAQTAPETVHEIAVEQLGTAPDCVSYASYDFGNIKLGSIAGFKFKDCDVDGVRDESEVLISGWKVTLDGVDVLGRLVTAETTTNNEGTFTFADLWPGLYAVCEEQRSNWVATTATCLGLITVPTDTAFGWLYDITVPAFGNVPLGSVTACKFYDYDEDGVNDGLENGEGPVGGVQFDLYKDGTLLASGATGDDGCVTFSDLYPGMYTLVERLDLLEGTWEATTETEVNVDLACEENASAQACFGNVYWQGETAWAANGTEPLDMRYVPRGTWATYVAYDGTEKTTTLFAGQTMPAGTVAFSAPTGDEVTITITVTGGWRFGDTDENVKIQDYATAPTRKPEPGLFDHKTTVGTDESSVTVTVPLNNFYGVHVEVERKVPYSDL